MKTKIAKLSLFAALASVPLGLMAELPEWPTPDFLPKSADVYPVFVNPAAAGTDTGESWNNAAPDLNIGPISVPTASDVPGLVQIIMAAGLYTNGGTATNTAAISIPSTIQFNVDSGGSIDVPVVAVRGGYTEDLNAGCAGSSDPILTRVDTRQEINAGIMSAASIGDALSSAVNNGATVFDGQLATESSTRSVIEIADNAFPLGLLIDNVVIARGQAELTTISDDEAIYGGGVFIDADASAKTIHFHGVTFYANTANARGGALYIEGIDGATVSAVNVKISYSTFYQNDAQTEGGGALWNDDNELIVVQTLFEDNTSSQGQGAAVYTTGPVFDPSTVSTSGVFFVSNVFFGNFTGQQGGAAFMANGSASAWVNNTFVSNHAQIDGGALNFAPNAVLLEAGLIDSDLAAFNTADSVDEAWDGMTKVFYNNLFVANTEENDFVQIGQIRHDGFAFDGIPGFADYLTTVTYNPVDSMQALGQSNVVITDIADGVDALELEGYAHLNRVTVEDQIARALDARGPDGTLGTADDSIKLAADSSLIDAGYTEILRSLTHAFYQPTESGYFYNNSLVQVGTSAASTSPSSWHRDYHWGYGPEARGIVDIFFHNNVDEAHFNQASNFVSGADISVTGAYNTFWRYGLDITTVNTGTAIADESGVADCPDCPITRGSVSFAGSWYEQNLNFRVRDGIASDEMVQVDIGAYEHRADGSYSVDMIDCEVIYVDDNAPGDENGVHDGNSWRSAYLFLQDAILRAQTDATIKVIRVAQGENQVRDYEETDGEPVWQAAFNDNVHYNPGRPSALYVTLGDFASNDGDVDYFVNDYVEWDYLAILSAAGSAAAAEEAIMDTQIQIPATLDARTAQVYVSGCFDDDDVETLPVKGTPYPFPSYFTRDRYEEYRYGQYVNGEIVSTGPGFYKTFLRATGPSDPDDYMRTLVAVRVEMDSSEATVGLDSVIVDESVASASVILAPAVDSGAAEAAMLSTVSAPADLEWSEDDNYVYGLTPIVGASRELQVLGGYQGWRINDGASTFGVSVSVVNADLELLRFPQSPAGDLGYSWTNQDGDVRAKAASWTGAPGNPYALETVTTGSVNDTLASITSGPTSVGSNGVQVDSAQIFSISGDWIVELQGLTVQDAGQGSTLTLNGAGISVMSPAAASLHWVTVSGNKAGGTGTSNGGGIYASGDIYVYDSLITDNVSGTQGGGIAVVGADISLWNSDVYSNTSESNGGGLYLATANADVRNSEINWNSLLAGNSLGGGIFTTNSNLWIDYIAIDLGYADVQEDSIEALANAPVADDCSTLVQQGRFDIAVNAARPAWAVENCFTEAYVCTDIVCDIVPSGTESLIHANTAYEGGGGIYVDSTSQVSINNATIQYNEVFNDRTFGGENGTGGGLMVDGGSAATVAVWLHNTNVLANIASFGGGAYVDRAAAFEVDTSLVVGNWARWGGGGLHIQNDPVDAVFTDNSTGAEEDMIRSYWINESAFIGNRAAPLFGVYDNDDRPYGGGIYSLNGSLWVQHSILHGNSAPYGPAYVDDIDILTFATIDGSGVVTFPTDQPNYAPYVARMLVFNSIIDGNAWYNRPNGSFLPVKQIGGFVLYDGINVYGEAGNSGSYSLVSSGRDRLENNPELGILWSLVTEDGFYYGDPELGDTVVLGEAVFDTTDTFLGPRGFYYLDWHNPAYNDPEDGVLAGAYLNVLAGKGADTKFGTSDDELGFRAVDGIALSGTCDYWGNASRHMGVYADTAGQVYSAAFNMVLRVLDLEPLFENWYWSWGLDDYIAVDPITNGFVYSQSYGYLYIGPETGPGTYWMYGATTGSWFWVSNAWGPNAAYNAATNTWGPLPSQN
jgi:hypothetical protein